MTDVNKCNSQLIHSRQEAYEQFYSRPTPAEFAARMGTEVEMTFYYNNGGAIAIPDANMMARLRDDLASRGCPTNQEPAGTGEYASPPYLIKHVACLITDMTTEIATMEAVAAEHGLKRSPFSILPTTTMEEALDKIVPRERLVAGIEGIANTHGPDAAHYGLVTTSVQTSFSPKDQGELFRMTYRGYAITPLLIAAMDNGSGYIGGEDKRYDKHLRTAVQNLREASGIAESFLKASTPGEFLKNHIDTVYTAPMYFAYDADGSLIKPDKGAGKSYITFEELEKRGLNTQSNYELAESFLYNDIKICNLRDEYNNCVGKRVEVRAADSGFHQPASVTLLTAALLPDGPTADAFDALLKKYGFTGQPKEDADLLKNSRHAATHHQGKFMDVAFGTGSMRDFAKDVAALVKRHYLGQERSVWKHLKSLTDVLTTGETDAKRHAAKFGSLDDIRDHLKATAVNSRTHARARLRA